MSTHKYESKYPQPIRPICPYCNATLHEFIETKKIYGWTCDCRFSDFAARAAEKIEHNIVTAIFNYFNKNK